MQLEFGEALLLCRIRMKRDAVGAGLFPQGICMFGSSFLAAAGCLHKGIHENDYTSTTTTVAGAMVLFCAGVCQAQTPAGTHWSSNEPYIGLGEGFILQSASNHTWIQRLPPFVGD